MASKKCHGNKMTLEKSLTDLVLKPRSEKIRRPPNAFMLFARDHRSVIASRHPDVSNKAVSSLLGQIWKSSDKKIKEKYFEKARILDQLHKVQYPDYVYSPREARLQKMNKKRKKDEIAATSVVNKEDVNVVMKNLRNDESPEEENWEANLIEDKSSSSDYVPNNPEYLTEQSPEYDNEEPPNQQPCMQYPSELEFQEGHTGETSMDVYNGRPAERDVNFRWLATAESCECSNRDRLGAEETYPTPYRKSEDETSPHFQNPLHCSYSTSPPFCNTSAHFPRPISSCCCGPAQYNGHLRPPYAPPFHSYWSSYFMNPHCHRSRDYADEDISSFPFRAPYHGPEFCRPPFGYFDGPVAPHDKNHGSGLYQYFNESWDRYRHLPIEFVSDNPESRPCASTSSERGQNVSNLYVCSPPKKEEIRLQNENQFQSSDQQINELENQHGMNKQTDPSVQIPENDRKDSQSEEHFVGNQSSYDSKRDKNEQYLADSNNEKVAVSENGSGSFASPYIRNIPNSPSQWNIPTEKISSLETSHQISNCVPLESTEPHIKIIAGMHPCFTTTQFEEMCKKRSAHLMKNTLLSMPGPSVIVNNTTSDRDSSVKSKDYAMNNDQSMYLQPLSTYGNMNLQTSREKFDTATVGNHCCFENLQQVETNNNMLNFQLPFSHRFIKDKIDKPCSSSSNDANKRISSNEARVTNSNEQIYSPKTITKSGIYKAASTEKHDVKDGHRKTSNNYSKKLADNLKNTQNFMDTTELDMSQYNQKCTEQKDLPKMYYEQHDGSYVAEDKFKFTTVNEKVPKLILNDCLATSSK